MPTEVKLPRLGQGMDEGKILSWLKSEGDAVAEGDEIYEVETEKVNVEVESPAAGTLLKIVVGEGGEVPIGTVVAWIGEPGESIPDAGGSAAPAAGGASATATPGATAAAEPATEGWAGGPPSEGSHGADGQPAPVAQAIVAEAASGLQLPKGLGSALRGGGSTGAASSSSNGTAGPAPTGNDYGGGAVATGQAEAPAREGRIKASPLARRIAGERGLDLGTVQGSGPDGRVIARDLEGATAVAAAPAVGAAPSTTTSSAEGEPGVERVELTSMRRTIARRLGEAWQAPVFFLTVEVDMTASNALRARLVSALAEGEAKPTVSDIITKACAAALRRHPAVNVHFLGDAILRFDAVHVGMAVSTDAGLVVPVLRDAHAKTIRELAADRVRLIGKARGGKLGPADMEGGTFTVSNLGMLGVDEFTAVLNPPMAAILAIGQTVDTPVVVDGEVVVRPRMRVTGTFDHRAVDGADGARFLQTVKAGLEDPLSML